MVESQLNPYESSTSSSAAPQAEGSRRDRFSGWFFVTMVLGVLLFTCLLVVPPGFIEIYEDFEVVLPLLTRIAIHWSLPAIVLVVTLLFAVKEFLPFSAKWKRKLNLAAAVVVCLVTCLLLFGLSMPLIFVMGDLS